MVSTFGRTSPAARPGRNSLTLKNWWDSLTTNTVTTIVVAFVFGLLPPVAVLQSYGLSLTSFVNTAHPVRGWVILCGVAVVGLFVFSVGLNLRHWRQRMRARPYEPMPFDSCGVRWRLTMNFWASYRTFRADEMTITGTLLGPLCPGCETDVTDDLLARKSTCGNCAHPLNPTVPVEAENKPGIVSMNNSDPLWPIRKAVYRQAQAQALKGELRPLGGLARW